MNNLTDSIKQNKEALLKTMHEWLDPKIMEQITISGDENNGSFYIIGDDAPDVKKYKAVLNILNSLAKLSANPSAVEKATLSLDIYNNVKEFNVYTDNLSEFKSYFSELFTESPTLADLFQKALELAQYAPNKEMKSVASHADEINKLPFSRSIIESIRSIKEDGISLGNIPYTTEDVVTFMDDSYNKFNLEDETRSKTEMQYNFEVDKKGNYIINDNDSNLTKSFKESINTLHVLKNILGNNNKSNSFNSIAILARLSQKSKDALLAYNNAMQAYGKLDFNKPTKEYAKALHSSLKDSLLSVGPLVQELTVLAEMFEVNHGLKQDKLVGLVKPIVKEYEQALDNLNINEEERTHNFRKARKDRLVKFQDSVAIELKEREQHLNVLNTILECLGDARFSSLDKVLTDKLIFIRDNLVKLDLPKEVKNNYETELNAILSKRKEQSLAILASLKNNALMILPYEQLIFLKENIALTSETNIDIESYIVNINEIISTRSALLNNEYAHLLKEGKLDLAKVDSARLQILHDNIELLNISIEHKKECKASIEQTLKERENKNSTWSSYFRQKLVDISQSSLNIVKSTTDAFIYITGTSLLNKIFHHAEIKLQSEASQISYLKERDAIVKNHLDSLTKASNQEQQIQQNKEDQSESEVITSPKQDNKERSTLTTVLKDKLAENLISARSGLLNNLEKLLDPFLFTELNNSKKGDIFIVHKDDSRLIKNYKLILNIITCITELSVNLTEENKRFKGDKLLDLLSYLGQLRIDNQLGLSEQFKLILEGNRELAAFYNDSVKSIQNMLMSGQVVTTLFSNIKTELGYAKSDTKSDSNVSFVDKLQSSLAYLTELSSDKSLTDSKETKVEDTNAYDFVDSTMILESELSIPQSNNMTLNEGSTNHRLSYANTVNDFANKVNAVNTHIKLFIKASIDSDKWESFKNKSNGQYKINSNDTESVVNAKIMLNSLESFEASLKYTAKALENRSTSGVLTNAISILNNLTSIIVQSRKLSINETGKKYAEELLAFFDQGKALTNKSMQSLVCYVDILELNYGLKQGTLIRLIEPAINAYQSALETLNIQSTKSEDYPYYKARLEALNAHKLVLQSELQIEEEKHDKLTKVIVILNNLQTSSFENIDGNDLQYLRDHLSSLNLEAETAKNFKYNLDTVILKRINALSDIMDINIKSGINFLTLAELRTLRDDINLIPLTVEQKTNLLSDLHKQIIARLEEGDKVSQEPKEVAHWLSMKGLYSAGLNVFKNATETASNLTGFSVQSQVLTMLTKQRNELEEKISDIRRRQTMLPDRILHQEKTIIASSVEIPTSSQAEAPVVSPIDLEAGFDTKTTTNDSDVSRPVHTNQNAAKIEKAMQIINELNEYCNETKHKLEMEIAIQKRILHNKIDAFSEENAGSRMKRLKTRLAKTFKLKGSPNKKIEIAEKNISVINQLLDILHDKNTIDPVKKLTRFGDHYNTSDVRRTLRSTPDSKIISLLKKSGYYFAKFFTFGKANLFQPPQQQLNKKLQKKIKSVRKDIITQPSKLENSKTDKIKLFNIRIFKY